MRRGDTRTPSGRLVSLEGDSRSWGDADRAEYALYRGMTHASLGDIEQATLWLREARTIEDTHPGSLSGGDLRRLREALSSL